MTRPDLPETNPQRISPDAEATGCYGKLPALGDFVTRRLPVHFVQPWDLWLQEALAESRSQLGDSWLDLYLVSPLWRFVLAPGIAGQGGWAGVLMPSVDRVGRYFPLTLARGLAPEADGFSLLCDSGWFKQLEQLALSSLDDGFELQAFDVRLSAVSDPQPPTHRRCSSADTTRPDAWKLRADSEADLRAACPLLLQRALDDVFLAYSLWWTTGSERVGPTMLTCQGLPAPDMFSAMLGGDWEARGWTQLNPP